MNTGFTQDYFALFDLPVKQSLDVGELNRRYLRLQAEIHPDKFAHLGATERRLALQKTTLINEAFQTLKDPLSRADYILKRQQHNALDESNTGMPMAFLMEQMEWREELEMARAARDIQALEQLLTQIRSAIRDHEDRLVTAIDQQQAFAHAVNDVRQLKFLQRLREEVKNALEAVED